MSTDLPTPQYESIKTFIYDFPEGVLTSARLSLITRIAITLHLETDGERWHDWDCYGYRATIKGVRDKRSGRERLWLYPDDHVVKSLIDACVEDANLYDGRCDTKEGTVG